MKKIFYIEKNRCRCYLSEGVMDNKRIKSTRARPHIISHHRTISPSHNNLKPLDLTPRFAGTNVTCSFGCATNHAEPSPNATDVFCACVMGAFDTGPAGWIVAGGEWVMFCTGEAEISLHGPRFVQSPAAPMVES